MEIGSILLPDFHNSINFTIFAALNLLKIQYFGTENVSYSRAVG